MASKKENLSGMAANLLDFSPQKPAAKPKTDPQQQPEKKQGRGKQKSVPAQDTTSWERVTSSLRTGQAAELDQICIDIRKETGVNVKRSEVLRTIIDALGSKEIKRIVQDNIGN